MLTLCILNFNGNDSLRESIQSVMDQTYKPDRFVVIDNASTDGSRQIAMDFGIKVVDANNKYKFITGLNKAIDLTGADDDLFFMQNDVILQDPDCLKEMIHEMYGEKEFIAQPVIYEPNGKIDNAGMDYKWPGYGIRRNKAWWNSCFFQECGLVTTICFLLRTQFNYNYDPIFSPAYYEDVSFFLDYNLKHYLIPTARAVHLGNHTFSQTYKKKEISEICRRNRRYLIKKHYSGLNWFIRSAMLAFLDILKKTLDIIRDWRIKGD